MCVYNNNVIIKTSKKEKSGYMANEVVKYHNDLNTVNMRGWTKEEMNFMFAVLSKAKEKGTDLIEFDKEQLTELAQYSIRNNMRLHDVLKNLVDHVTEMKYIEETTHSYEVMNLFQRFKVQWNEDYTEMHATIRVSSDFEYILNQLNANFTKFELDEFIKLRSTYAKQMYRLLKQWRTKGYREYSVKDLRYLLAIPDCYKASHIDERVMKPIKKELSKCFMNFKIKPIKKRTKGNPIIAYQFSWTPEKTNTWIEGQPQPNPNKPKKQKEQPKALNLDDKYYPQAEEKSDEEIRQEMLELQRKLKEGSYVKQLKAVNGYKGRSKYSDSYVEQANNSKLAMELSSKGQQVGKEYPKYYNSRYKEFLRYKELAKSLDFMSAEKIFSYEDLAEKIEAVELELAEREAEARQAQRRARSRSYGIER